VGDEFTQRWIQQTDRHWIAIHDSEQFRDVLPLHDQQLVQGLSSISLISGQDHLPHGYNSLSFEEHVLSADKANALGTEFLGLSSISRGLGIGSDLRFYDAISLKHAETKKQISTSINIRVTWWSHQICELALQLEVHQDEWKLLLSSRLSCHGLHQPTA
jgi:hypothetical protein